MAVIRLALALIVCILGTEGDIIVFSSDGPGLIEDEFVDEPAGFGDGLPLEGLKGFVVPGVPKDGCKPLARPPTDDNFTGKWIVLLARYNCDFEEKIRNAQAAGYDAAIVHNVNSTDLERMSAKNAVGIKIPSVFVSNETGYDLEINYTYKNDFFVVMNREVPFDINTHLLLPFAVVVGLCLITMIIFMIVKCIKDRRRAQRHRLPNNALRKIPTCRYSKGDPYDTCAICLDDYLEGDKLRVLPCAHAYHCKCIDPWLTKNRRVCPVCKRRVFAAGEQRRRRRTSDSGTSSDDSSAPLMTPRDRPATQGGTFASQRENPFAAAERFVQQLRRMRGEFRPANNQAQAEPETSAEIVEEHVTEPTVHSGAGDGDELPATSTAASGASVPFLSGVLNLRTNHFGRSGGEDAQPLLTEQSSLPDAGYQTERRPRRTRAARRPRRRSLDSDRRGQIGVAALPNTDRNQHYNV